MMGTIAFAIVAALMLISALLVVSSKNLVRAVLWLGVTLTLTAALYAMLEATFMAGVQVLLYVGGVVTLMLFGLMLTRRHEGLLVPADSGTPLRGILGAGAVFGLLASATVHSTLPQAPATEATSATVLGRAILGTHLIAFEALSLLLLAVLIGAIVIARRRDFGAAKASARAAGASGLDTSAGESGQVEPQP